MMVGSMTTHAMQLFFLALTPSQRWDAARSPVENSLTTGTWLTALAVVAQVISLIIVFWLIDKNRRLKHERKQAAARFEASKNGLQREIDRLTAANEEFWQDIVELSELLSAQTSEQIS